MVLMCSKHSFSVFCCLMFYKMRFVGSVFLGYFLVMWPSVFSLMLTNVVALGYCTVLDFSAYFSKVHFNYGFLFFSSFFVMWLRDWMRSLCPTHQTHCHLLWTEAHPPCLNSHWFAYYHVYYHVMWVMWASRIVDFPSTDFIEIRVQALAFGATQSTVFSASICRSAANI